MKPIDFVILFVVAAVLVAAAWFIHRSKKKGAKCIGCPDSCCSAKNGCAGCKGCGSAQ